MLVARGQQNTDRTWPTTMNLRATILFFRPLLHPKTTSRPVAQITAPAGSIPAKGELLQGHCKCCSKPRAPAGKHKCPTVFLPRNPSPCNCVAQRCSSLSFLFHCLSITGRRKTPYSTGKRSVIQYSKQVGVIWPILTTLAHFHTPTSQTKSLTQHQFGASIWFQRPLDKK